MIDDDFFTVAQVIEECDSELRESLSQEAELDFDEFMKLLRSG